MRFINGARNDYPPFPESYFTLQVQAIFDEYRDALLTAIAAKQDLPEFPEKLVTGLLHNTWHDTAEAVINNWIGKVYQLTNSDRKLPFMDGVDPDNPLGLN